MITKVEQACKKAPMQGKHHSIETRRKMSEANIGNKNPMYGKNHSEESKKKIGDAETGEKNHFYGKHLSLEHKKKMSELRTGSNNPFYGKVHSEATKKRMIEKRKGDKNANWKGGRIKILCEICGKEKNITQWEFNKNKHHFCSYRCLGIWNIKHMKHKDTSIELLIENEFKKQSIPYKKQMPIEGIAVVDFLLPDKVIVQCDGTYWHSKEVNKGRDIAQDTILGFKGYKIFRFTEMEIKRSPNKCINQLRVNNL